MLNFSHASPDQLYAAAVQHHMAGRAAQAEQAYRQILAQYPTHADSWHMLGILACQHDKPQAAVDFIQRAIQLNPQVAAYHTNLGEACRRVGKLEEAEAHFKSATRLDPRLADAHTNLAALYSGQKRHAEALQAAETALALAPENPSALRFAADSLTRLNRPQEALAAYARALAQNPDFTDARFNFGILLLDQGRAQEAAAAFRQVIAAAPDDWDARLQLIEALERLGRGPDVAREMADLLQRNPGFAQGHAKYGNLLRNSHHLDNALAAYARAIALEPDDWVSQANRAYALRDQARLEESIAIQRGQVAKNPTVAALHSGLIFSMQLVPDLPPDQLAGEQNLWNRRHADPFVSQRGNYANPREPNRRLRIGYVSADLRSHSVGRFMLPLIRNHDRAAVEVFCYQASRATDGVTGEIRAAADHFIALGALTDDQAAQRIRADGIDILVDLNNHTIDNRLPIFARKPAPVQISYLAFCAGTGLETMDYRLTDRYIDPVDPAREALVPFERPLRLAETYWCYAAHAAAGPVAPLPALGGGGVTFGAFNYFSKCNDQVLGLWADLLGQIPSARLRLHVPVGSREGHVRGLFQARGIGPDRLTLVGRVNEVGYFQHYSHVDVALDTFPWAGGTTTCDALFMGVPVITLAPSPGPGPTLQRGGMSILSNLGYPEWIAGSPQGYIGIARALAGDIPGLARIRAALRPRMEGSVLMDGPRFARNMEAAYRRAWEAWCGG